MGGGVDAGFLIRTLLFESFKPRQALHLKG